MYCVIETQFYCDGNAEQCAAKFNAMLDDLKALLEKHPGVTCTAFGEDDWRLTAEGLQEYPESQAELDAVGEACAE